MKKSSFGTIVFSGIFGILFFLILLGVLNIISSKVGNPVFESVVGFLNQNLLLILKISIVLLLANVFELFVFPFNTLYPLFNAYGGILWVVFIFRALSFVDTLVEQDFYGLLTSFYYLAIIIVPVIILIVGYVKVFSGLVPKRKKPAKPKKSEIEWEDVGEQFKEALYYLGKNLKESLAPRDSKKKRRTKRKS